VRTHPFIVLAALVSLVLPLGAQEDPSARLNKLLQNEPKTVYVAAHRGDWRDAPENSIQSLRWAAKLGVDIVEFDLKRTKDGGLVVMHDFDVDRTTTGHGLVSDLTLEDLKKLNLRAGTGHPTKYTIPTFAEELEAARQNHVILDIDTGWDYYKDVLAQVRATRETDQVIINVFHNTSLSEVERRVGKIPDDVTIMEVVNMERPDAESVINSYAGHRRTIIQCDFKDATVSSVQKMPEYQKTTPIWTNGLWPDQNGGHDDDTALDPGPPDQAWGWLISRGANVIQTDRPRELLEYLQQNDRR
jgi:glycerophosphoryl diester phosphodiesterase